MKGRFWIGVGVLALAWGLPGGAQMPEAVGNDAPVAVASTGGTLLVGEQQELVEVALRTAGLTSTGGTLLVGEQQAPRPAQHPLEGALLTLALPPLVVVWGLSLGAFLTLVHIFWPRLVQREYEVLIECPGRALVWGIGWGVGYLVLFLLLSKAVGLGQLLAVLLSLATLAAVFLGLAGTAISLGGQGLALARREGASPLARLAAGSALIVLVSLFPLFGQLLLLYLLLLGLGSFRLAITSLPPPVLAPPAAGEEAS